AARARGARRLPGRGRGADQGGREAVGVTTWWCEQAWLGDAPVTGVRVHEESGVITAVQREVLAEPGDRTLRGLVLAGFANAHSHAFHRAMRGRTHDEGGTFWTWRERMY